MTRPAVPSRPVVATFLLVPFVFAILAILPAMTGVADAEVPTPDAPSEPVTPPEPPLHAQPAQAPTAAEADAEADAEVDAEAEALVATPGAVAATEPMTVPATEPALGAGNRFNSEGFSSEGSIGGQQAAGPAPATGDGRSEPPAQTPVPDATSDATSEATPAQTPAAEDPPADTPAPEAPAKSPAPEDAVAASVAPLVAGMRATGVTGETAQLEPTALPGFEQPVAEAQAELAGTGADAGTGAVASSPVPAFASGPEQADQPDDGDEERLVVIVPDSQTRLFLVPIPATGPPCTAPGCQEAPMRWRVEPVIRPEDQQVPDPSAEAGPDGTGPDGPAKDVLVPLPEVDGQSPGTTGPPRYAVVSLVQRDGVWTADDQIADSRSLTEARARAEALAGSDPDRVVMAAPPQAVTPPGRTDYWTLAPSDEIKLFAEAGVWSALGELFTPRGSLYAALAVGTGLIRTYPTYLGDGLPPAKAWRRAVEYSAVGSLERDVAERTLLDYNLAQGAVWNVGAKTLAVGVMVQGIELLNKRLTRRLETGRVDPRIAGMRALLGNRGGPVRLADKVKGSNLLSELKWWQIPAQAGLIYTFSDVGTPLATAAGVLDQPIGYDHFGQPQFATRWGHYKWLAWEAVVVNGLPSALFGLEYLWQGLPPELAKTWKGWLGTPASRRMAGKAALYGFLTYFGLSLVSNTIANSPTGRAAIAEFNRRRLHPDPRDFEELRHAAQTNEELAYLSYGKDYVLTNLLGTTNPVSAAWSTLNSVVTYDDGIKPGSIVEGASILGGAAWAAMRATGSGWKRCAVRPRPTTSAWSRPYIPRPGRPTRSSWPGRKRSGGRPWTGRCRPGGGTCSSTGG